jgi:hypothetical protein
MTARTTVSKKSIPVLTAENLKTALWDTLQELRSGEIQPGQGDAIAAQAREIVRTVKAQLQITSQSKRSVPQALITFAED